MSVSGGNTSSWPLAELADRVRALSSGSSPDSLLVRVALPAPLADPVTWLQAQPRGLRAFWSGRDRDRDVAMVGAADTYSGGEDVRYPALEAYTNHMLEGADSDVRYYGGVRFDAGRGADELWQPFGSYRFVLPRFEYVVHGDRAELACNLVWPRDRDRLETVARACRGLSVPRTLPQNDSAALTGRCDEPARDAWMVQIERALTQIARHTMQKVVLARRSTFDFDGRLSALNLLDTLRTEAPHRFHFLFEVPGGTSFVGATPERLFRREGTGLVSEAVAGTRPRSVNAVDDEVLRSALMHSDKDQREHLSVRWAIEEILRPFCEDLTVDAEATEMRLAQGRHLVSRFRGTLRPSVSSWNLLRHLHPTPAVGGYPAKAAIEAIRTAEQFDRGWYAGPVGWIGADSAEFAVALRCGLVRRDQLHLFSGAGIVQGSEPAAEWDEIEHKIVDFATVLGLLPQETE